MLSIFLALLVIVVFLAVYLYGRASVRPRGAPSVAPPVSDTQTALDAAISPLLKQHPGETGLWLLTDNLQAFAVRAAASRHAQRSLDLQYYYWKDDLTGGLLAYEVIQAADRGVKVRLLIDDINARGRDKNYRALDRHPNIEVRLFNPTRCRDNALLRGIEMLIRFWSVNRRMHHKVWIADGRLAVVGGRNIGDAYFDAAEDSNFRDMDVVAIGPAAVQTGELFDRYWNSAVVFPIRSLAASRKSDLQSLRQRLEALRCGETAQPYLGRVRDEKIIEALRSGIQRLHWTKSAKIVSDPREKASDTQADGWLLKTILPVVMSARETLEITSPYFIPREEGTRRLLQLAGNGVAVSVLTNSLAATDVAAVHGAYVRYRKPLVEGGVRLFELRAVDADRDMSLFGSKGASLHTKAFVVDGVSGFVGSFNFDPRSVALNTEMGILFDHAPLAAEMQVVFQQETSPKRSFRIVLREGRIGWQDGADGSVSILREPDASLRRRMVARMIGLLPIESQL